MTINVEEENKYFGPEHTVCLYDANIIRIGNEIDGYYYEVCHEDETELYQNTEASYSMIPDRGDGFYQRINSIKLEVLTGKDINISKKILKQIQEINDYETRIDSINSIDKSKNSF